MSISRLKEKDKKDKKLHFFVAVNIQMCDPTFFSWLTCIDWERPGINNIICI